MLGRRRGRDGALARGVLLRDLIGTAAPAPQGFVVLRRAGLAWNEPGGEPEQTNPATIEISDMEERLGGVSLSNCGFLPGLLVHKRESKGN